MAEASGSPAIADSLRATRSRPRRQLHIAIAGGSIAGLSAGIALRAAGHDVVIYERSEGPRSDRGAGITLQAEGLRFLETQRLATADEIGLPIHTRTWIAADGSVIEIEPRPRLATSWNVLYRLLRAAFPDDAYRSGYQLERFQQDGDQALIFFANGYSKRVDLLVCADGTASVGRRLLLPDRGEPHYSGFVAWRGLIDEAEVPAAIADQLRGGFTTFRQAETQMLCYFVPGRIGGRAYPDRLLNWIWYTAAGAGAELTRLMTDRNQVWHDHSVPPGFMDDALVERARQWATVMLPPQFAMLVHLTRQPFLQPVLDLAVPQTVFGCVCLVGDAAFVLRPVTAYATSKALADADTLASALADGEMEALRSWDVAQTQLGASLFDLGMTSWAISAPDRPLWI